MSYLDWFESIGAVLKLVGMHDLVTGFMTLANFGSCKSFEIK